MQKIAEQKKKEALEPGQPSAPNESDIATLPKQTVSTSTGILNENISILIL